MKPLLDVLVILDALDKEGSFAAASAKLYKTPSALSYTIHKLESDLNIQLLDRSGHRARFTRTGQMLLEKGRDVLHTARELEKQAVRLHQGWENTLILNVDATFPFPLLAPSIAAFYRQHHATRHPRRRLEGTAKKAAAHCRGRRRRLRSRSRLRRGRRAITPATTAWRWAGCSSRGLGRRRSTATKQTG